MPLQVYRHGGASFGMKNMDVLCDRLPIVSTISNIVDLALKYLFIPLLTYTGLVTKTGLAQNYYFSHIQNKDLDRCLWLLVPVVGNGVILYRDYKAPKKDGEEADLLIKSLENVDQEGKAKLAEKLLEYAVLPKEAAVFYDNADKFHLTGDQTVKLFEHEFNICEKSTVTSKKVTEGDEDAEGISVVYLLPSRIKDLKLKENDRYKLAEKSAAKTPVLFCEQVKNYELPESKRRELALKIAKADPDALLANLDNFDLNLDDKKSIFLAAGEPKNLTVYFQVLHTLIPSDDKTFAVKLFMKKALWIFPVNFGPDMRLTANDILNALDKHLTGAEKLKIARSISMDFAEGPELVIQNLHKFNLTPEETKSLWVVLAEERTAVVLNHFDEAAPTKEEKLSFAHHFRPSNLDDFNKIFDKLGLKKNTPERAKLAIEILLAKRTAIHDEMFKIGPKRKNLYESLGFKLDLENAKLLRDLMNNSRTLYLSEEAVFIDDLLPPEKDDPAIKEILKSPSKRNTSGTHRYLHKKGSAISSSI